MKQLLFLLLFPCFALAQYQGNSNQKITLGEQTTADGLVFRGVASIDTVTATSKITRANKQDTSAFLLLDTVTNLLWHYKTASNGWIQAGGSTLDTATMLLPYYRSGRALGTPSSGTLTNATGLPISTGLTGLGAANRIPYASSTTELTTSSGLTFDGTNFATTGTATATRFNPTANTQTGTGMYLPAINTLGFSTNGTNKLTLFSTGNLAVGGTSDGGFKLDITGTARFSGLITSTIGNNSQFFVNSSATTGYLYASLQNTGANFTYGIERSTGGALSNGSLAYASILQTSNATSLQFGTNNNIRATIDASGNVGIGTAIPQSGYRLHVVDSVYVGGNVSASAYTTRSDYDLKDEIQNISYGINEVMQMQPVKYTYKSNGSTQIGFIAQDLGVITPEVVSFEDKMSVYYNALIPILTKAIQEQQALIKALEQRILILENK